MQYSWDLESIFPILMLQYDWVREFPGYRNCSAYNLSIDLLISNSHGPSMYTLSMEYRKECGKIILNYVRSVALKPNFMSSLLLCTVFL